MRHVSQLAQHMPLEAVGSLLHIGSATVRRWDKEILLRDLPPVSLEGRSAILIDEKYFGKSKKFATLVIDAHTGEPLYMEYGRDQNSLDKMVENHPSEHLAGIRAVGLDRGGAYQKAVERHFPGADVVFDPFHLISNLNQALDQLRREVYKELGDIEGKMIKGYRYLLLSSYSNIEGKSKEKLQALIEANEPLCIGYVLKEQFRTIFWNSVLPVAENALNEWLSMIKNCGLKPFERLWRTMNKGKDKILNFFRHKITNGKIEAANSVIAKLQSKACGIRDIKYLFLKMRQKYYQRS